MEMTKKEEKKFEWEKESVYKAVYLPVRFFKKEAYIHIDDYKEARDKREKVVKGLEQENKKLRKECEENDYLVKDNARWMGKCGEKIMEIKKLNIKIASLEGEIKGLNYTIEKLREENQYRESIADVLPEGEGHIAEETIQDLQKEIKLLKMSLEEKDENCYGLAKENKELKEKVETLELWLDNKEKLNEEYRKQIDKYKEQYQHSMGFSDFGGYDEDEHIVKDENTYRDLDL